MEKALEVLATFAEIFQGRGEWKACARWCGRAIAVAGGLSNPQPVAAGMAPASSSALSLAGSGGRAAGGVVVLGGLNGSGGGRKASGGEDGASLLLASLLTLRGAIGCDSFRAPCRCDTVGNAFCLYRPGGP